MTAGLRPFVAADADWLTTAHAREYAMDEGFDASFGVLVGQILSDFLAGHDPARERGWIAHDGTTRLGSIFCVRLDDRTAKLRLFFLVPEARGQGLGRRLLDTCTGFARDAGYDRMQLWTHAEHAAACALYARTGWQLEDSRPVHSFGVDLTEQSWSIAL